MLHVMFLSLITKITGDSQATTLLGPGLGMFIYILLGDGLGMFVLPLTWIWAACLSSLLLGDGLGMCVIARSRQVALA